MINYGKHNGFLDNQVYDIYQDSKGFIWMANDYGLSRYDGVNVKTYFSDRQTSLPGTNIKEDVMGRIWFTNFDGNLYYVEKEELKPLNNASGKGFIPFGLSNKYLYVFQMEGLDIYNIKTLKVEKQIPLKFNNLEYAYSFKNNFYWIQDQKLYKLDSAFNLIHSDYFTNKLLRTKLISSYKNDILVFSKYNQGGNIYRLNSNLELISEHTCQQVDMILNAETIDDHIWISTNKGILKAVLDPDKIRTKQTFLNKSSVSKVIRDKQGRFWFSTVSDGIFYMPSQSRLIYPLPDYNFNGIISAGQQFFLSTSHGKLYRFVPGQQSTLVNTDEGNHEIHYMYFDEKSNNLFYSNSKFNIAPDLNFSTNSGYYNAMKSICRVDDKYYAVAGSGTAGLYKNPRTPEGYASDWDDFFDTLPLKTEKNAFGYHHFFRSKSVAYDSVRKLIYYLDNQGMLEVGKTHTRRVLYQGKPFFGTTLVFFHNQIFILNAKGELYTYNPKQGFKELNSTFQLNEEKIDKIKLSDKYLLLFGSKYIYLLDNQLKISALSSIAKPATEIIDLAISDNQYFVLYDNTVINGNIVLNDKNTEDVTFVLNYIETPAGRFFNGDKIGLDYSGNDVVIDFSLIDFTLDKIHVLEYGLNGEEWRRINANQRRLEFTNLAAGSYTLTFRLNGKVLQEKIEFEIYPPVYQRWWFILIVLLIVVSVFYTYLYFRKKQFEKQIKLLNEKVKLEKELGKSVLIAVKSQMNPHFFYNALNSIQSFLFSNDKRKASNYLAKFSRLTRMILEMSDKDKIKLREETEALQLYLELEKMRFDEDLDYTITVSPDIDEDLVKIPSMMIQPYVENAIKHGLLHSKHDKTLSIRFTMDGNALKVEIEDNGIGRARSAELNKIKAEKHQSYAISANQKRLEILNRENPELKPMNITDKYDAGGYACGTLVTIYMPVS